LSADGTAISIARAADGRLAGAAGATKAAEDREPDVRLDGASAGAIHIAR
jgi:hypothetical protein